MIEKNDKFVRLNGQDMTLGGLLAREIPGGPNMTDCPTIETLSEFIEGKLAHDARESVVAHLGDCELCYSTLAESLAIREELNNRSRERIKKRFFYSIPAGLAAAAVLFIVFKVWQPAPERSVTPENALAYRKVPAEIKPQPKPKSDPVVAAARSFAGELANRLPGNGAVLPVRITGDHVKTQTSYGFSSIVPLEKAAFRIGACLVDLEVSLKAKDRKKTEAFAKKLTELLKPIESSYGPLSPVIASGDAGKKASRYEGFSSAVEALFKNRKESVYMNFGSWVEASRLAAEAYNSAFFQPADIKGFKKELEQSGAPIGTLRNLQQFDSILSSGRIQTDEFTAIARLLADIKEMY
ncbi:MAG: hypothetical protein A2X58_03005 [Nitrospirae bacterium GWC2_56_14]|nr:MAG: hypothetical protein A2X58_03005 [Nitrospirae bacterium GWC2_56_14]